MSVYVSFNNPMPRKSEALPAILRDNPILERDLPEASDFNNLTARQKQFMRAFLRYGVISMACRAARITRQSYYNWMQSGGGEEVSAFSRAFRLVEQMTVERAEAAMLLRGINGWDEPVFYRGRIVGHVRKFSDEMLKLALRSMKPEKYSDRKQVEVANKDGQPFVVRSAEPATVIDWQATVTQEMTQDDDEDVP